MGKYDCTIDNEILLLKIFQFSFFISFFRYYARELDKSMIESILNFLHSQLEQMLNYHISNLNLEEKKTNDENRLSEEDEELYNFSESDVKFDHQSEFVENSSRNDSSLETQNLERIMGDYLVLIRRITSNKLVSFNFFFETNKKNF